MDHDSSITYSGPQLLHIDNINWRLIYILTDKILIKVPDVLVTPKVRFDVN